MAYADHYHRFLQIEEDLDAFAVTVDGIPVWERARLPIFRDVIQQTGQWGQEHQKIDKSPGNLLKGAYLLARNIFVKNPLLAEARELMFWGFERRKKLNDGLYWDLFCDPLYESLELDYIHFEEPYLNGHLRPARTENLRYLDLIEYTGTLKRLLGVTRRTLPESTRVELVRISDALQSEFGVSIDVVDQVTSRLEIRDAVQPLYRRLLERVGPELVFVVVSFQKETFFEVCRDLGIPTVELQHGVLTEYEYGYPGDRTKETFPDYFFTYGKYWNNRVELPIPDANVYPVGYAHFNRQRSRLEDVTESNKILFISQGNVGEQLSKAAVELSRHEMIDPSDIVYKLHPGEYGRWKSDYPWLRDSGLRVVGESGPDLYELFAEASAQVGVYSTALFEGLGFGLATYLYDLPAVEELADLRDHGYARFVSDADELATALTDRQPPPVDSTTFFAAEPIDSFVEAVEDIASKRDLDITISKT